MGNLIEGIKSLNDKLAQLLDFINFITSPKSIALWFWHGIVEYSYIICFFICVAGLITWICGSKKGSIVSKLSIAVFAIIQAINACF